MMETIDQLKADIKSTQAIIQQRLGQLCYDYKLTDIDVQVSTTKCCKEGSNIPDFVGVSVKITAMV